jgi:hypothetical protein
MKRLQTKRVVNAVRKPATRFAFGLAILFIGVAKVQQWFVTKQVYATTRSELNAWAEKIVKEIAYQDGWNLRGYRNSSIDVPGWYVITSKGLVVDIEGFIPGLLTPAAQPDPSIYIQPRTLSSEIGEEWRLFGRQLKGGTVIVGIVDPGELKSPDDKLATSAAKFGQTLDEALRLGSRELDSVVDYVILNDSGEIKSAWGGIPLKADVAFSPNPFKMGVPVTIGSKSYMVVTKPILDSSNKSVGQVLVPKEITAEQRAIHEQVSFNVGLGAISFFAALVSGVYFLVREVMKRPRHVALEEARRLGEGQHIEFKPALEWDFGQGRQNKDLRLFVLKSIAAFLNSRGGTLFIGVRDDGKPCGIKEDLSLFNRSSDRFRLHLRSLITSRIGPQFAQFVNERTEEVNGETICIVDVDPTPFAAFVKWDDYGHSYVRNGPKTSDLDPQQALEYRKNRNRDS